MVEDTDRMKEEVPESGAPVEKEEKPRKDNMNEEEQLSEEDLKLKTDLELLVERLKEDDQSLYQPSLDQLH